MKENLVRHRQNLSQLDRCWYKGVWYENGMAMKQLDDIKRRVVELTHGTLYTQTRDTVFKTKR